MKMTFRVWSLHSREPDETSRANSAGNLRFSCRVRGHAIFLEDRSRMPGEQNWLIWSLLSAAFAAMTAILAKVGVAAVDSDLATLLRTFVVVIALTALVVATGKWQNPASLPSRALLFLGLSGLATGASWFCYFRALKVGEASQVAPVDKLSVILVAVFAVIFLGERPAAKDWVGIALVGAGALLISLKRG